MAVADSVAGKIRADAPRHGVKMICDVPLWRWRFLHTQPFPIPLCEMMVLLFMLRMSCASECGAMGDRRWLYADSALRAPVPALGGAPGRPVPSRRVQRANRPRGPAAPPPSAVPRAPKSANEGWARVSVCLSLLIVLM